MFNIVMFIFFSGLKTACFFSCVLMCQGVWSAVSGCVGLCVSAERANGHETVNLRDGSMEPLHLSAAGRLLMPPTVCLTLLHSDSAHRSLDWSTQHEKKLLFEGKLYVHG